MSTYLDSEEIKKAYVAEIKQAVANIREEDGCGCRTKATFDSGAGERPFASWRGETGDVSVYVLIPNNGWTLCRSFPVYARR